MFNVTEDALQPFIVQLDKQQVKVPGKELMFSDTPLREVLQTIGVVYGKKVTVNSMLSALPVTATFTGELVENVLAVIAYMTNTIVADNASATTLKKHE